MSEKTRVDQSRAGERARAIYTDVPQPDEPQFVTDDTMSLLQAAGTLCVVDLTTLNVDREEYQREIRPHHKRIAKEFDPRACHPLIVGRRQDRSLWVIDGQQRREALIKLGITRWNAVIFNTDGPETEARIFAICGGARGTTKPLSKGEVVRSMIAARDPLAVEVKKAVEEAGLKWKTHSGGPGGWPNVSCHTSLLTIARQYGATLLERALKLIQATWPNDPNGLKAEIVWSVGTLLGLHPSVEDERFTRLLSKVPALHIVQAARSQLGGWKPGHAYKLIVQKYNWKLTAKRIDERPLVALSRERGVGTVITKEAPESEEEGGKEEKNGQGPQE